MKRQTFLVCILSALVLVSGCAALDTSDSNNTTESVDGADGSAQITTDYSVSETTTLVGTDYNVSTTVTNEGDGEGEHTVELAVEGETVDSRTVTVDADSEETVTLSHQFDEAGEYTVTVGDREETVSAIEDPLPGATNKLSTAESFETEEERMMDLELSGEMSGNLVLNSEGTGQYNLAEQTGITEYQNDIDFAGISFQQEETVWFEEGTEYTRERQQGETEYEQEQSTFDDFTPSYDFPPAAAGVSNVTVTDDEVRYTSTLADLQSLQEQLGDGDSGFGAELDSENIESLSVEVVVDRETETVSEVAWTMRVSDLEIDRTTTGSGTITLSAEFVSFNDPVSVTVPEEVKNNAETAVSR